MPGRAEAVAGLPVSLPLRPALLAGREELLAELDARLTEGDGSGPRVVALHGLGGAGKTSVAVEYAHRHLAEVGLAWQFPAGDREVLLAEFVRLAVRLGAREVADARDPVASVHAALAAFPADWLLEFDDAIGYEAVRGFLPPAGRGRVLITSQSGAWPGGWAVEVPVLGTRVAAEFLVNRTGDPDVSLDVYLHAIGSASSGPFLGKKPPVFDFTMDEVVHADLAGARVVHVKALAIR